MKKKKRLWQTLALLLVFCSLLLSMPAEEPFIAAASSYDNALEFFNSTGQTDGKHVDVADGKIYFATQAKKASSSSNLRYVTLGFDVTLTGGGKSLTFAVKRGDSLAQIDSRTSGNYEYILYEISTKKIIDLASAVGGSNAKTVLSASTIKVQMDAIMTTKQNDVNKGSINENGCGGLHENAPVYHLNNPSHLKEMKGIFSGHTFDSYKEIEDKLDNYQLSIIYSAGDGASVGSGYSKGTYTAGSTKVYNVIHSSGTVVRDNYKLVNEFYLKSPSDFGLSKTGYHIESGKEWIKADGYTYSSSWLYMPKYIDPRVGYEDRGVILYANWQPNIYTIIYNSNGGIGSMTTTSMVYDTAKDLRKNTFVRAGYTFNGWNTKADGTGTAFADQKNVKNIASSGTITLYAQWKPCVYKITADKQGGSGGTDSFWEKMDTGFYSSAACTSAISKITIPSKTGYDFLGYYSWIKGGGKLLLNSVGDFAVSNTFFLEDSTVYADWEAQKYTINFDKQGGSYGSDSAIATYDSTYPHAEAPIRTGYRFMGYYTQANGAGDFVYNEFMVSDQIFQRTADETLYAYWVDDVLPEITLSVSNEKWTNQEVILTADAKDYGTGLKSVKIYQIGNDESLTLVAEATSLNGTKTLTFTNTTEGVIRYKAVAIDIAGNTAESYNVVYYDITAPGGDVEAEINGDTFYFDIEITDINTGD